ncbi:MAG: hypothetical protein J07HR59_01648 [Halorubrum sp. J07HR59]|nr:MAG: hypothetical protein J07HR59_01648 [Halorubrum sp. J07HR59]
MVQPEQRRHSVVVMVSSAAASERGPHTSPSGVRPRRVGRVRPSSSRGRYWTGEPVARADRKFWHHLGLADLGFKLFLISCGCPPRANDRSFNERTTSNPVNRLYGHC